MKKSAINSATKQSNPKQFKHNKIDGNAISERAMDVFINILLHELSLVIFNELLSMINFLHK